MADKADEIVAVPQAAPPNGAVAGSLKYFASIFPGPDEPLPQPLGECLSALQGSFGAKGSQESTRRGDSHQAVEAAIRIAKERRQRAWGAPPERFAPKKAARTSK